MRYEIRDRDKVIASRHTLREAYRFWQAQVQEYPGDDDRFTIAFENDHKMVVAA